MKTICSFCNTIISEKPSSDKGANHGICESCFQKILSEFGFNLKKFLDMLDAPVFLVDSDGIVLAANTLATVSAKKPVALMKGKLCGDVLGCINTCLPQGCGKTANCPDCVIRSSVEETYNTGKEITRRSAMLIRNENSKKVKESFLVSTRKDGNAVLLRLELKK